jgi:outer membrane protein assembly factor BamB
LEYKADEAVKRWVRIGAIYQTPAEVQGAIALGDDAVLVTTADGRVLRIAGKNRDTREWKLEGRITSPPQLLFDRILLVTDRRQIVSLDPAAPPEKQEPEWTYGPLPSRICGAPVVWGDQLLVTDEGGQVTGLDAKTGGVLWRVRLGRGAIPAAAATPIAPGRLLVPLRDGAVMQCPLPQTPPASVAGAQT